MLVLSRKRDEKICIGRQITVTVLRVKGRSVQIGIEAPGGVRVLRGELVESGGRRATGGPEPSVRSAAVGEGRPQRRGEESGRSDPTDQETSKPGRSDRTDKETTRGEDAGGSADAPSGSTGMMNGVLPTGRHSSRPTAARRLIALHGPVESAGAVTSRGHDLGWAPAGGAAWTFRGVSAARGLEIPAGQVGGLRRKSAG